MAENYLKKSLSVSTHALRIRWAAIGAAVAVSLGGGVTLFAQAGTSPASSSTFVAVSPVRVLDTRDDVVLWAGPFVTGVPHDVKVTGSIQTGAGTQTVMPAGSTGVVLNVTVLNSTADGFVSVRPADATRAPQTSNINFEARKTVANSITVNLPTSGADAGTFEVWFDSMGVAGATADILVDVTGYYSSTSIAEIETAIDNKSDAIAIIGSGGEDFGDIQLTSSYSGVVWENGRWLTIYKWEIPSNSLYFESTDCTGDAFVPAWDEFSLNWFDGIGKFFEPNFEQVGVNAANNNFHSVHEYGACTANLVPSDFQRVISGVDEFTDGDYWIGGDYYTNDEVEFYVAEVAGQASENLNLMWEHVTGQNNGVNSFSFVPRSSLSAAGCINPRHLVVPKFDNGWRCSHSDEQRQLDQ